MCHLGQVEDEIHFLFHCPALVSVRELWISMETETCTSIKEACTKIDLKRFGKLILELENQRAIILKQLSSPDLS